MREALNQYSSAFVVLALVVMTWVVMRRRGRFWRRAAVVGLVMLVGSGYVLLRTGSGDIRAVEDLDRAVGHGRPVMLELYSNW